MRIRRWRISSREYRCGRRIWRGCSTKLWNRATNRIKGSIICAGMVWRLWRQISRTWTCVSRGMLWRAQRERGRMRGSRRASDRERLRPGRVHYGVQYVSSWWGRRFPSMTKSWTSGILWRPRPSKCRCSQEYTTALPSQEESQSQLISGARVSHITIQSEPRGRAARQACMPPALPFTGAPPKSLSSILQSRKVVRMVRSSTASFKHRGSRPAKCACLESAARSSSTKWKRHPTSTSSSTTKSRCIHLLAWTTTNHSITRRNQQNQRWKSRTWSSAHPKDQACQGQNQQAESTLQSQPISQECTKIRPSRTWRIHCDTQDWTRKTFRAISLKNRGKIKFDLWKPHI